MYMDKLAVKYGRSWHLDAHYWQAPEHHQTKRNRSLSIPNPRQATKRSPHS